MVRWLTTTILIISGAAFAGGVTVQFTNVADTAGIQPYTQINPTGGVQAVDYDDDGWIDLFVPMSAEGGAADRLYRNLQNGTFEEVSAAVGLDNTRSHRTALWFDYDGDHLLDLVVAGDCRIDPPARTPCADVRGGLDVVNLELYRQLPDHTFINITTGSGLEVAWTTLDSQHRGGLAAGDFNNDGWVDFYVATWNLRAFLFLNNEGDGTFEEIASTAGMGGTVWRHQQPIIHDFNGDGLLDIYQAIDFHRPNFLWINQDGRRFQDMAPSAGLNYDATDMGVDLADFDNDGDLDLYVTNITQTFRMRFEHNVLFRNDGDLSYEEIAVDQGVAEVGWGWGATFMDVDNDGDQDLAVTNGRDNFPARYATDPSKFFLNNGAGPVYFSDVSAEIGFNDSWIASGLVAADFDRDGDLDIAQAALWDSTADPRPEEGYPAGGIRLLRNDMVSAKGAAGNHWLVVRPRSEGTDHFVPGTIVRVAAGGINMMRLITAGKSTLSQEPMEAFFGLGTATAATVTIEYLDGRTRVLENVAADQVITHVEKPILVFKDSYEG